MTWTRLLSSKDTGFTRIHRGFMNSDIDEFICTVLEYSTHTRILCCKWSTSITPYHTRSVTQNSGGAQ